MRSYEILSLICLAACSGAQVKADSVQSAIEPIHEPQGTSLIGGTLPLVSVSGLGARDAAGRPVDRVAASAGALEVTQGRQRITGADAALAGLTLAARDPGGAAELRVTRACPHARRPSGWVRPPRWTTPADCSIPAGWTDMSKEGIYEYQVEYRRTPSDAWAPLCDPGDNRAVPIGGTWSRAGEHQDGADFSFACTEDVAAKCLDWGYLPWRDAAARDLHQACTRMARADYEGDGSEHTIDGTEIAFVDRTGIHQIVAGRGPEACAASVDPVRVVSGGVLRFNLEAAWGPSGAVCMSRTRWNTLPLGVHGDPKHDPRMNPQAKFCEELVPGRDWPWTGGAVLCNRSTLVDRGLYRWTEVKGGRSFTTTRHAYEARPKGLVLPQYEGAVFRADLPESLRPGTVALVSYRVASGAWLTTTGAPPVRARLDKIEGYIFPTTANRPKARALYTWWSPSTGSYHTTVLPGWDASSCDPSPCREGAAHVKDGAKDGFVFFRHEGFVMRGDSVR